MATKKNDDAGQTARSNEDDAGQAEVQARSDEAAEKGYFGEAVDETPRDEFTLQGVAKNN